MNKSLPLLLLLAPTVLHAGEADTLSVRDMDEVVIVSTPKEHISLRQQPLSSTSLGEEQLQSRHIDGIKGLSAHIPGLFIPAYGSRLTSSIYLRGVGSRIGTPAVGMYVDDIPVVNMSSMDQDLTDAERVDILRGPQGTLYGRNTMGGLIRVYTKNPMNYQGTDLMFGVATYNNYRARVTHYHRPSQDFAFSAGVSNEHSGGFFKNRALGDKHADRSNDIAAHWRGIYRPNERTDLDFSARYQWTKQGAYPYAAKTGTDAGEVAYNRDGSYLRHNVGLGFKAEHRFNCVMLSSVTGFQFLKDEMDMDQDYSRQDIFTLQQKQNSKVLNEEITLKSQNSGRWKWTSGVSFQYQWLRTEAPVTFYQEGVDWLSQTISNSMSEGMMKRGMGPATLTLKNSSMPMGGSFCTPTLNTGIFHQSTFEIVKNLSLVAGIRLDYEHISMKYDAPGCPVDFDFAMTGHGMNIPLPGLHAEAPYFNGKVCDDNWHVLPRAALKYDFGQGSNVYASVSRGYRSGGYNVQLFSDVLQTEMRRLMTEEMKPEMEAYLRRIFSRIPGMPPGHVEMIMGYIPSEEQPDAAQVTYYKPETSWNYEIGSHLNFFDGRLKADLAAYWIETRDLQISQMAESGLGRITVNAGKSRSLGMEASVQAAVTDALGITASYGFTHATATLQDTEGNDHHLRVPFAPKHTATLGAQYTWHTSGWLQDITLGAFGKANGRIYWTRKNDISQPFYALLDARLTVRHDNMEFALWGNNLTKTRYDAFSFVTRGTTFAQRGTPLQVGIDCRMKF